MKERYLESRASRSLLFAAAMLVGLLHVLGFWQFLRSPYTGIYQRNLTITNIKEDSPNLEAGLERGDRILSLDGEILINVGHYNYLLRSDPSLAPRVMEIVRSGESRTITVASVPQPNWVLSRRVAVSFVAYTFLVVGLLVYARRWDTLGTLFLVNCALIAFLLTIRPVWGGPRVWILGEVTYDALTLLLPTTFLHFFLVFPERSPHPRWLLRIRRWLYLVPVLLMVLTLTSVFLRVRGAESFAGVMSLTTGLSSLYLFLFMVTALIIFIRAYFTSQKAVKEKIRFVIFGVLLGVVPFTLTILLKEFFPSWDFRYDYLSLIFLSFISISFGYAILKHGVLDLRIVVRRSLVYTILSAFIIALYYSTVRWFGDIVAERFAINQFILTLIPAVVIAIVFAPLRSRIQTWVDRHFYREEIRFQETVPDFSRELSQQIKAQDVIRILGERLQETLHPQSLRVYGREDSEEPFLLTWDLIKGDSPPPPSLAPGSTLEEHFGRVHRALVVEFLSDDWGFRRLDRASRIFLQGNRASIVAPLGSHGKVTGLLSLGEKRSGKVYTETEVGLLETLVDHAAIAMENAEMHDRAIRQEALKQELAVAHEMQANLLPKSLPSYPGVDLFGKMESSAEVGGDFFDYRDFGHGRIGIAIGDVSGKGIPGAMVMASLNASFRTVATEGRGPAEVLAFLNRKLREQGDEKRFVTFFYGILDLKNRTFVYANGGHPPPILFHGGRRVTRLQRGGLLLGVKERSEYQEGVLRIPRQSTLIFYTDGIIEERDDGGRFYGEEGVVNFYWNGGKKLPAASIVEHLFRDVLEFGGTQQDDMTVIVARFS